MTLASLECKTKRKSFSNLKLWDWLKLEHSFKFPIIEMNGEWPQVYKKYYDCFVVDSKVEG